MKKSMKAGLFSGLLLILTLAGVAQTSSSRIGGTVTDATGAALNGATITVRNQSTNEERSTKTADNGSFAVVSLPPATYLVSASQVGFGTRQLDALTLQLGQAF